MGPDRYRDEVIPGDVKVEVLARTGNTLAFARLSPVSEPITSS